MSVSTRDVCTLARIDLVIDAECPHADDARALLRTALARACLPPTWWEWDRSAPETPAELRGLGSPTILVNGLDVSGAEPVDRVAERANCCRVYENGGGLRGVPALEPVVAALWRGRMSA